jgi:hypothetical protein
LSGVYRQCFEFTGSVRSIQAVSEVYRQCLKFTGSVRSLKAVSGVFRQCPEITGSIREIGPRSVCEKNLPFYIIHFGIAVK